MNINGDSNGNFNFLQGYDLYLLELAELVEGNLYINPRLCAVYLRLLCEGFFDRVKFDHSDINFENYKNPGVELPIKNKLERIINYGQWSYQKRSKPYLDEIFPTIEDESARPECPKDLGDDTYRKDPTELIDSNTIYVWNLIRHVGNSAAHSNLKPENTAWLEQKYVERAVEEICTRMYKYFRGFYGIPS